MYAKIKNTLAALTVALGALMVGYSAGEPTPPPQATVLVGFEARAMTAETPAAATPTEPRRRQGFKRQLAMPFIAIAPLLSRRGA